jgi:hypothetical protein
MRPPEVDQPHLMANYFGRQDTKNKNLICFVSLCLCGYFYIKEFLWLVDILYDYLIA